jgi:Uma2 family endonuclease
VETVTLRECRSLSSARAFGLTFAEGEVMGVAIRARRWTLAQLHRLPEDGNKYELVRGELFVTPPPGDEHETILAKLNEALVPYVRLHGLGHVYRPYAVMRFEGSEVEPDLMVRSAHPDRRGNDSDWTRAPIPILVVEVLSGTTRRRDLNQKKSLYLDAGVAEYWVVDPEARTVVVVDRASMRVETESIVWSPAPAGTALTLQLADVFE